MVNSPAGESGCVLNLAAGQPKAVYRDQLAQCLNAVERSRIGSRGYFYPGDGDPQSVAFSMHHPPVATDRYFAEGRAPPDTSCGVSPREVVPELAQRQKVGTVNAGKIRARGKCKTRCHTLEFADGDDKGRRNGMLHESRFGRVVRRGNTFTGRPGIQRFFESVPRALNSSLDRLRCPT